MRGSGDFPSALNLSLNDQDQDCRVILKNTFCPTIIHQERQQLL